MNIDLMAAFFGWGALLNLIFLTFVFVVFMLGRNIVFRLHEQWFSIPKETVTAVIYGGMAWFKLATFLLFVIPYLVVRFFM